MMMRLKRGRIFCAAPLALAAGAILIYGAANRISYCGADSGAKATKDGTVVQTKTKAKRKPIVIDNTTEERTSPPVVFQTWPQPEPGAAEPETPLQPAQPVSDVAEQLRALEMPQAVEGKKLYSFRSENLDIKTALALFARANNLNIVPDLDVAGNVTLDVHELTLQRMLQALLEANDYAWTVDEGLIRVHASQTRTFALDYLRMIRSGIGSTTATLSGGSSQSGGGGGQGGGSGGGGGGVGGGGGGGMGGGGTGGGAGGGAGGAGGSISGSLVNVNQNNPVDFWKELEEQLEKLVTEKGKTTLAVNKTSGLIEVSDRPSALKRVERFLANLDRSVHRQVEIEVKLYDVTLRDQFQFGIDWERLAAAFGGQFGVAGEMIYKNPTTGVVPIPNAGLTAIYTDSKTAVAVKALQEQGDVKVISQPRIRVLNNQTALIKVGTDTPFFGKNVQVVNTGVGTSTAITTDSYQLITIGTILSLTPQISSNNLITLDVSPVITSLLNTHVSASGETTAPELEIKQASSIVRLRDGETAVLGGLIQNRTVKNTRRIPLVSDIPGFGQLFTGRLNQKEKRELVIFLTPKIVK